MFMGLLIYTREHKYTVLIQSIFLALFKCKHAPTWTGNAQCGRAMGPLCVSVIYCLLLPVKNILFLFFSFLSPFKGEAVINTTLLLAPGYYITFNLGTIIPLIVQECFWPLQLFCK